MIGLVGTVGGIKFGTEIGLDHIHNPAGKAVNRPIVRPARAKAAATGLDRPRGAAVNVFFAFACPAPYQWRAFSRLLAPQTVAVPGGAGGTKEMAKPSRSETPSLADLRRDIDRIDETMHALLMERGDIIDRLIAVKQTQETGSAFRPAREAEMMRRLVGRHAGILPLDTVESIWRVIIATFTYVQAPFSVHADLSTGDAAMRDSARFHFGFTVPFVPHMGAASVVAAVSDSKGDLGLVPAFATAGAGAWWSALEFDTAPKIIARLPFVDRADHPAAVPVFVVSRAAADAMVREVETWSVRVAGWSTAAAQAIGPLAEVIAVPDRAFDGAALLISVPQDGSIDRITDTLVKAGASVRASALVGSHATRYRVSAQGARPASTGR
jgi:chorismate mutase